MTVDVIPLWVFFVGTIGVILMAVEFGFLWGKYTVRHAPEEKESPAAAVGGAVLGLVAFILAFTFSIVSGRYDTRKELVRSDAEAIRTAWFRADFLPEPDRTDVQKLLRRYLDIRLDVAESKDPSKIPAGVAETLEIQKRLWAYVVANGKKDPSDISALVVESINELINIHAIRFTIAIETRIPSTIWIMLYVLSTLGMLATGYQMGVAGPRRSRASAILAISFALAITLIAALDRPESSLVPVSQKPLQAVRSLMDQSPAAPTDERTELHLGT